MGRGSWATHTIIIRSLDLTSPLFDRNTDTQISNDEAVSRYTAGQIENMFYYFMKEPAEQ